MFKRKKYHFNDFTENAYRDCIRLAKSLDFSFIPFTDYKREGKNCLWRHDIDFSPHRALALAKIENTEGISANYFVWLHSDFYNPLELEVKQILFQIHELGHSIGLHFDSGFYENSITSLEDLEAWIIFEKEILERTLAITISAFSFHNPIISSNFSSGNDFIGGMVNVYSDFIKSHYTYCSDSFCYWRYRRLADVIQDAGTQNLHALTHPECWQEKAMSPYKRILRTFEGRKTKSIDKFISRSNAVGRKIIK